MASNMYTDLTPSQKLDKTVLNKMVWRSYNLQGSFNFERMQAAGWLYSIAPGLEKIHTNKEDLSKSMKHNLEFFNTHPFLVTFVMGIVLSLEQEKFDTNTIRAVRVAAMGPLGGIGDALFWFTLVPILASIGAGFAINGNILGPIIFLVGFNAVQFAVRYYLMHFSYKLGESAIAVLTKSAQEFTHAASLLGVFIVGALIALLGGTTVAIEIVTEASTINIQSILDGILPKMIPLGVTLGLYYLIKKRGWTPIKCIVLLLIVGIVGAFLGIF